MAGSARRRQIGSRSGRMTHTGEQYVWHRLVGRGGRHRARRALLPGAQIGWKLRDAGADRRRAGSREPSIGDCVERTIAPGLHSRHR